MNNTFYPRLRASTVFAHLLLCCCFLFTTTALRAQQATEEWAVRYNGQDSSSFSAVSIAADASGNSYVTGTSSDNAGGIIKLVTIKYSPAGQQLWLNEYSGGQASAIVADNAGGIYVAGTTDDHTTDHTTDYLTVRYDAATGTQSWASTYSTLGNGSGPSQGPDAAQAIAVDGTGGVYVTGTSSRGRASTFATVRYAAATGVRSWASTYAATSFSGARAIAVDNTGGVYVTGTSNDGRSGIITSSFATVRYDAITGAESWTNTYQDPINPNNVATAIAVDNSGGLYITGYNRANYQTVRYAATTGAQSWVSSYNGPANGPDEARAIAVDNAGGVYVTGTTFAPATSGSGLVSDYATVRYEAVTGAQSWVSVYNGVNNGPDEARAIAVDNAGGVYVTGTSSLVTGTGFVYMDYATLRYRSTDGSLVWMTGDGLHNSAAALALDNSGNVFVTGTSAGTATTDGSSFFTVKFSQTAAADAFTFYRAINLNGPALTLDGHAWAGSTAPNYSTNGIAFQNQNVPLIPATDAVRTDMIRSAVYRVGSLRVALSAVPAGTYQVYAYVWEDNNAEVYSLSVNGQVVRANYNSGSAGTWARLGPYQVTLGTAGTIQLTSSGGTANFSGIELWQQAPNQAPVLAAIGNKSATVGQPLTFTAAATDPNAGQTLTYSLIGAPTGAVINPTTGAFSWTPTAAQVGPRTFGIRVTDNGGPVLTDEETITVTVSGAFAFYRAINLNGPALTLDGHAWAGSTASNYFINGSAFQNQNVPLIPATDAVRAGMMRSSVFGPNLQLTLLAVPAGTYQASLYVWEDNNAEVYNLSLNGQLVQANYNSGPAGTWTKLGPYPVTLAAAGTIQFATSGSGWANFSGVELWKEQAAPASQPAGTAPDGSLNALVTAQPEAYPNPSADGRFHLVLPADLQGEVTYTLVSALGRQLRVGALSVPASGTADLDFSGPMAELGICYLQLKGAKAQANIKLLRY